MNPGGGGRKAHRVLILGGGFAGLHAARALKGARAEISLLDRRNYHLFQPLLYQVATGSLSPGEIAAPLRSVLSRQKNVRVLLGEAGDVDPHAKRVALRDGATLDYDSLIVATGSESSYYGRQDWSRWAPSLKSVEEATLVRTRILYAFEAAERMAQSQEEWRAWLTFVLIGAGTTGLEMAGALAEIARETLRHDFRAIHPEQAQIILIEGAARVLPSYPEDLSAKAEGSLKRLGVEVLKGSKVTALDGEGVMVETPEGARRIAAKTVLWAGGVSASEFGRTLARRMAADTDRGGRIRVNPDLTIPGFPEVFVTGDLAWFQRPDGRPLPGVAQVAIQEGAFAARTIADRLKGRKPAARFQYRDLGDMAVIGRHAAVARLFGVHLSGLPAWLIWLFVHLMNIVEFQSRVLVFIQWGFQYLTFSRGARLITGEAGGTEGGADKGQAAPPKGIRTI